MYAGSRWTTEHRNRAWHVLLPERAANRSWLHITGGANSATNRHWCHLQWALLRAGWKWNNGVVSEEAKDRRPNTQ